MARKRPRTAPRQEAVCKHCDRPLNDAGRRCERTWCQLTRGVARLVFKLVAWWLEDKD